MDKNIHVNHRQRMRKRYRQHGLEGFHDHEVLEILLYHCYPRQDTNLIAHKILREFKTLQSLFDASIEVIMERIGCTENVALLLNLMPAIAKRYLKSKWSEKTILSSPEEAGNYAVDLFAGDDIESFYIFCLGTGHRLNHVALIARGTIDEVPIFTRELVRKVIEHNAVSIILAHNHPSGMIRPSLNDDAVTTKIRDALRLIDVIIVDHIVVATDKYFSYAQRSRRHVDGY